MTIRSTVFAGSKLLLLLIIAVAGAPGTAIGYLFCTLALALAATAAGLTAGGWLTRRVRAPQPIEVDAYGRLDSG